jgi:2'-5' RNA ligase
MDLTEHYDKLYSDSIQKIRTDKYQIDNLINSPTDNRFGITLLIRPDEKVKCEIKRFLDKLRVIEPEQYYYPDSDIHVTVMPIISCYNGFELSQISTEEYIEVISKSILGFTNFSIEFKGLTASPSCVMVQGFLKESTLNEIRDNLRNNFMDSMLQQSIDKRYSIQTAHSSIFRLRKELENKKEYLELIEEYRDFYFGTFSVNSIELVFNDLYQRKGYVKELYRFEIQ